jgi:hypothetical protein
MKVTRFSPAWIAPGYVTFKSQCCSCGVCLCVRRVCLPSTWPSSLPLHTSFLLSSHVEGSTPLIHCVISHTHGHLEGARSGTVVVITFPYSIVCGGCKKFWKRTDVPFPYSKPAANLVFTIINVLMTMRADCAWRRVFHTCGETCHVDEFCVNISGCANCCFCLTYNRLTCM